MDRHDAIQPLLTDYALGDLPAAERARVEAHLAGCAECAADARELEQAFQGIGLANEPLAPPAHLRQRVLASLEGGTRPAVTEGARDRTARSGGTGHPAWLALAATLVVVLGGLLTLSVQRSGRLANELRRLDDETARLAQRVAETSSQADLAVTILTAADMRRIDLQGVDVSRNATARAYWSATRGLLIVADRLPAPPPGRTYQVWLIGSSAAGPVSAGLIGGGGSGRGMLIVTPPGGVTGEHLTVAVTDEPMGGLPAPTGAKHLAGSL